MHGRKLIWCVLSIFALFVAVALGYPLEDGFRMKYHNNYNKVVRNLRNNWESPILYLRKRGYIPKEVAMLHEEESETTNAPINNYKPANNRVARIEMGHYSPIAVVNVPAEKNFMSTLKDKLLNLVSGRHTPSYVNLYNTNTDSNESAEKCTSEAKDKPAVWVSGMQDATAQSSQATDQSIQVPAAREPVVLDTPMRNPCVLDTAIRDPAVQEPGVRNPAIRTPAIRDRAALDRVALDRAVFSSPPEQESVAQDTTAQEPMAESIEVPDPMPTYLDPFNQVEPHRKNDKASSPDNLQIQNTFWRRPPIVTKAEISVDLGKYSDISTKLRNIANSYMTKINNDVDKNAVREDFERINRLQSGGKLKKYFTMPPVHEEKNEQN